MMKTVITGVLCAVLAGALGFWGGVTYQKNQTPAASALRGASSGGTGASGMQPPAGFDPGQMPPGAAGMPGAGSPNGSSGSARRFAGGVATGTVLTAGGDSITLKVASGGSKTVYLSSTTRVVEQQVLKASDIKVGDSVMAMGESSNGGITARTVQIVPEGADFRPGF